MNKTLLALLVVLLASSLVFIRADEPAAATESSTPTPVSAEPQIPQEKQETFQFQAEVSRLMDIIINSLYSNREIFLRELISNASDALDKIRFLALTDKGLLGEGDQANLDIHINFDKDAKTLTITDKGVGMTKTDLIKHLGVVANSGTTQFLEAVSKGQDSLSLIGQFGVGFYSVYLVADRVTVISKHNDDKQHIWSSTANSVFTIAEDPRGNTLGRGTSVILYLKDDAREFLDESNLERITTKYSQFIQHPIYIKTKRSVTKEVPVEDEASTEAKPESESGDDDLKVSDDEDYQDEASKPKTKTVTEEVDDWKQVNENKAIWTRKPNQVTEEEYQSFYKTITKDTGDALTHSHFSAEGEISFKSILYIPKTAAFDLYDKYYSRSTSLKLYVRRVLISDEFEDLMPRYLNFIKGVVDSDDLPLNVSRETLSKSKVLKVMGKKLTRKALELLKKLADEGKSKKDKKDDDDDDAADDEEEKKKEEEEQQEKKEESSEESSTDEKKESKYDEFFKQFGKSIKLGVMEDASNKSKLTKLLRFVSSKSDGKLMSLQQYIDNMKPEQKYIYYITGESAAVVSASPFIEKLKKKDIEVLYMVDALDEYLMNNLSEYENKKFMCVTKEGFKLDESDDEKAKEKAVQQKYEGFAKWLKEVLGDKVEKVVVSSRITNSPCVLVTGQWGWSANMERIMKAQTFANNNNQQFMVSKKTMEINPRHPLIKELKSRSENNAEDDGLKDAATLLYDAALLNSGFSMDSAKDFASRIHRVLANNLNLDSALEVNEDEEIPTDGVESDNGNNNGDATANAADGDADTDGEINLDAEEPQVQVGSSKDDL